MVLLSRPSDTPTQLDDGHAFTCRLSPDEAACSAANDVRRTSSLNCMSRACFADLYVWEGAKSLRAVNGVSLSIPKGQVVGLVGESGCGKSTLANILLGLQKPTSGDVLYSGQNAGNFSHRHIARRIQPIFQDPYSSLNATKTVHSIISLPLRIHRVGDPSEWDRKVHDMLDLVGLPRRVAQSYPRSYRAVSASGWPSPGR